VCLRASRFRNRWKEGGGRYCPAAATPLPNAPRTSGKRKWCPCVGVIAGGEALGSGASQARCGPGSRRGQPGPAIFGARLVPRIVSGCARRSTLVHWLYEKTLVRGRARTQPDTQSVPGSVLGDQRSRVQVPAARLTYAQIGGSAGAVSARRSTSTQAPEEAVQGATR
jgi:hypothetical protein